MDDSCLTNVKEWGYLDELDLSDTLVTDQGLAELGNCRYLKKLNLQGTKVTAAGAESLRALLPECSILWTTTEPNDQ